MKAVIIQALPQQNLKAGDLIEATDAQEGATLMKLIEEGKAITEGEHKARQQAIQAREASIDAAISASKAFAPKEDTSTVKARALTLEAAKPGDGVAYIASLPAREDNLAKRVTASGDDNISRVELVDPGLRETIKGYIRASEPFEKEIKNGGIVRAATRNGDAAIREAVGLSHARAHIAAKLADMINAGADFRFDKDLVKAGDYADPAANNPLGVLNTGLTLQWNLGFLANQLPMLSDIVTDISSTPVLFNQVARTRYIIVPGVQLKTTSSAWTGTTGTVVDVNVAMDTHAGVPISINENILGATARQLFNEQKTPQLYALGEYIIYKLVNTIVNGSTRIANDGTSTSTKKFNTNTAFNVANSSLKTFVSDLPEAMDEAKLPGGDEQPSASDLQRFAWVHGRVYASATADTNFVLNQSIWGAVAKTGENVIETGRFSRLGNLKFRKSQLMTDQVSVTSDGNSPANYTVSAGTFSAATTVGFAGTRNSLLFVSRVPVDYSKVLPDVPPTAAIELVTEPKTGITFMVVKYLDHAYETANMRVQLMFGTAVGDERQGILLNIK